jgi:hypothetical protein
MTTLPSFCASWEAFKSASYFRSIAASDCCEKDIVGTCSLEQDDPTGE